MLLFLGYVVLAILVVTVALAIAVIVISELWGADQSSDEFARGEARHLSWDRATDVPSPRPPLGPHLKGRASWTAIAGSYGRRFRFLPTRRREDDTPKPSGW